MIGYYISHIIYSEMHMNNIIVSLHIYSNLSDKHELNKITFEESHSLNFIILFLKMCLKVQLNPGTTKK